MYCLNFFSVHKKVRNFCYESSGLLDSTCSRTKWSLMCVNTYFLKLIFWQETYKFIKNSKWFCVFCGTTKTITVHAGATNNSLIPKQQCKKCKTSDLLDSCKPIPAIETNIYVF